MSGSASELPEEEEASESEGGRSPGWAGAWPRLAMAACFLALAAARRASRLTSLAGAWVLVLGPAGGGFSVDSSSEELSSEEDSSELEVGISSSCSCRGKWVCVSYGGGEIGWGLGAGELWSTYAPETDWVAVFVGGLEITAELFASCQFLGELLRPGRTVMGVLCTRPYLLVSAWRTFLHDPGVPCWNACV